LLQDAIFNGWPENIGIGAGVGRTLSMYAMAERRLSTLPATCAQCAFGKETNRVTYHAVRQTEAGPVSNGSSGMTRLQPCHLINIIVGERAARARRSGGRVC
jgi:hypothetical protein